MRWLLICCTLFIFPAFPFEMCYFDVSGVPDNTSLETNLRETFKITTDDMPLRIHAPNTGENINEAFKNMVKENETCNGLVFSGYHTGGHFHQEKGDTTDNKNKLNLSLIEQLSCDPKYKQWFENVRQLWLFGSHTVNDEYLQSVRKKSDGSPTKTGDKLATPVAKPEDTHSMRKLNLSFAHVMDEGTPLSSRYMRAFPNTHIYGWNDEAPTSHQIGDTSDKGWKGTHPIFEHIKQIGQAAEAEEATQNKTQTDKQTILAGVNFLSQGDYCDKPWEAIIADQGKGVEGVRQNKYGKVRELGCDLINAQKAINEAEQVCKNKYPSANEKIAKTRKQRQCEQDIIKKEKKKLLKILKAINKTEQTLAKAREILKNKKVGSDKKKEAVQTIRNIVGEAHTNNDTVTVSHLLFSEIYSSHLTARKHPSEDNFFQEAKKILSPDSAVIKALKEKTESPVLSTVRKVDYIEFYKYLHGDREGFVSKSVQSIIDEKLECAYWRKTTGGKCSENPTVEQNSHLETGRREGDKITPEHHYTLTAVVSDQLKQYNLLSADQAQQLQDTLQNTPDNESNDYIKQITKCLTEEDFYAFYECKNP